MIIAIYVNNLFIYNAKRNEINNITEVLKVKFHMSDLGQLSFYLWIAVTQDHANRIFCLRQSLYSKKISEDRGMWHCKAIGVSINGLLIAPPQDYYATNSCQTQYLSAVISFIYGILGIWPDFAFSVSVVSRYASNLNLRYWQAVKPIFSYICGTFSLQLTYYRGLSNF